MVLDVEEDRDGENNDDDGGDGNNDKEKESYLSYARRHKFGTAASVSKFATHPNLHGKFRGRDILVGLRVLVSARFRLCTSAFPAPALCPQEACSQIVQDRILLAVRALPQVVVGCIGGGVLTGGGRVRGGDRVPLLLLLLPLRL